MFCLVAERHWQERGSASQAAKGICHFEDRWRRQSEAQEETSRPALSDLLITACRLSSSQTQTSRSVRVQAARWLHHRRQWTLTTTTANESEKPLSAVPEAVTGIAFGGNRSGTQTLTQWTEKYAEGRLSHVVSHICRRPH